MRSLTTDEIRSIVPDPDDVDDFTLAICARALFERCDALDETPEMYGFEFAAGSDKYAGDECYRKPFYAWRLPREKLPDGFTSHVYIFGPDDGAEYDAEVTGYYATIFGEDSVIESSQSETNSYCDFDTVGECVAWLNQYVGTIKKEEA